jgi:hypothetical protein
MARHKFSLMEISYTDEDRERIEERVRDFREHLHLDDRQARVWEVISRYQGENGLSEHKVNYLTACVLKALEQEATA